MSAKFAPVFLLCCLVIIALNCSCTALVEERRHTQRYWQPPDEQPEIQHARVDTRAPVDKLPRMDQMGNVYDPEPAKEQDMQYAKQHVNGAERINPIYRGLAIDSDQRQQAQTSGGILGTRSYNPHDTPAARSLGKVNRNRGIRTAEPSL